MREVIPNVRDRREYVLVLMAQAHTCSPRFLVFTNFLTFLYNALQALCSGSNLHRWLHAFVHTKGYE